MPRQYKPLNSSNSQKDINPEQVASLASFITWSYLDPLVWKAARSSSLEYEDLPPIADYDRAEYIVPRSEKVIKRFKERHIFWGIIAIFSKEVVILSLLVILKTVSTFIAPFSLNQLLLYIQNGSAGAFYRPWMWVVFMFVGPMIGSFSFEYYTFLMMRATVRLEAIITQLVFDHALEIRVKEENHPEQDEGKAKGLEDLKPQTKDAQKSNLVGKINNLITTDVLNITNGRHFIMVVLPVARMIKLFGWEDKISKQIEEKREAELALLRKRQMLNVFNGNIKACVVDTKCEIPGANTSPAVLILYPLQTEVLDRLADDKTESEATIPEGEIGFRNASFTWSKEDNNKDTDVEERKFQLSIKGDLFFRRGQLNLVVGPTGSGKTSLLMALLGEMHYSPIGDDSGFQLPRDKGIALVVQEGWVQSGTIKENILFGSEYDEERYKKVQCRLQQDLSLFEAGDNTEIGEKGFTLSGGQNARVTLARAVYSKTEIVLIDDILASLDVHTGKFIVDNCFMGDLLKGRTVILVTHNVPLVAPVAEFVVSLDINGQIASQGSLSDALSKNERLLEEVMQEQQLIKEEETVDTPEAEKDTKQKGKLVLAEEVAVGHVSWAAMKLYYSNIGGVFFWVAFVSGVVLSRSSAVVAPWILGQWAAQFEHHPTENVSSGFYLWFYALALFGDLGGYSFSMIIWIRGQLGASRRIHKILISSVLGTTLRWLDTVPTARVIARCTQDIATIDVPLPALTVGWVILTNIKLTSFAAVIILVPRFIIPGITIAVLGFICGQIYMKAQLPIKRHMSNYRSPIIAHMNAMLTGLVSIRAYGAETSFRKESLKHLNGYIRPARSYYDCSRWVAIRSEALGSVLAGILALYILNDPSQNASNSGLALAMAIAFSSCTISWVRITNELEILGNSTERIEAYINIVQEPKPSKSGVPPAYWPSSGSVVVENLCARYSSDSPEVLHNVSFTIKSGEKVGVVGRTGSGKSTLTLSLLRCIPTEGKVIFDGINTESINLDSLRNSITIIPQRPELLTGTLRDNLDPFSEHSDATLNDALRSSGLFALQEQNDQVAKITLDSNISGGGANVSVGQRQILALARAILRGSKLVVLDEATSAIDYTTDAIIQNSLREASKDASLLIVAHRLNTIMDADKIIVLDSGNMVEFDSPANLLKKSDGYFKSLVDESGDREALYEIAEKAAKGDSRVEILL
ncbi:hypothetical protein Clacol_009386 [Clathrus columnatus]|uniref:P-loop containing nucleoside triphosphate hydrolase protein n=1 Tax=Clathrus columnatus TaxID=1419009 RepID=A0AAV5ARX7_9AGAM|nr:hypothetical protein Clacol_009386 [Clathrus columnatus]